MKTRLLALCCVLACGVSAAAQSTPGWLRYPAISPDGTTVVFTYKDQQLEAAVAELMKLIK